MVYEERTYSLNHRCHDTPNLTKFSLVSPCPWHLHTILVKPWPQPINSSLATKAFSMGTRPLLFFFNLIEVIMYESLLFLD